MASGGEGCYRCANGGNCTAPDFCTCTPEWTGHDCRTPVCSTVADAETVYNLNTVDPAKVQQFELDPCGEELQTQWNGALHGNACAACYLALPPKRQQLTCRANRQGQLFKAKHMHMLVSSAHMDERG